MKQKQVVMITVESRNFTIFSDRIGCYKMTDVKEISVTLTPQDQKSFSRTVKGGTRKRKEPKEDVPTETPLVKIEEPEIVKTQAALPSAPVPTPAPTPAQVPTATSEIIKPIIPIKIQSKKIQPIEKPLGPRINPLKKRTVLAKTLKKPTLQIPAIPGKTESNAGVVPIKKRNYTARRISIEMQPIAITRNNRRILKHNIEKMPLDLVKKTLLEKGILKQKNASSLSDELLRSMLKDYMSLHSLD